MSVYSILIISILLQVVAAFLALRLVWITEKITTWAFIAAAIVLMALRRCATLYEWISRDTPVIHINVASEVIALTTSILMVAGIALIAPLFSERKRTEETIRKLHSQRELILNSAWEGILGLDLTGNHTFVNQAAARMLGHEVQELIGKHSHSTWHHSKADGSPYPDDECVIYDTCRQGASYQVRDEVFWRKDGTSFPVEYFCTSIMEGNKNIGAVVTFYDITDRKLAEEALLDSEKKYRLLVDQVPGIFFKGYTDWSVDLFDDKVDAVTGYSKDAFNLRRLTWIELLFDEDKDRAKEAFVKALKTSGEYVREYRIKHKEGKVVWIHERGSITFDQNKRIDYVSGIFFDITERKLIEDELRQYREHLEDLVDSRTYELVVVNNQLIEEIAERKQIAMERENLIIELQDALTQLKTLKGLLPICASCKKIRDKDGRWQILEKYIQDHSEAQFSHGLCPECAKELYPEYYQ